MSEPMYLAGRLMARYVRSLIIGAGDVSASIGYASGQGWAEERLVVQALKAAVSAIDSASAANMVHPIGVDLAAFVRPQTIMGRMQGLRRVPLNTRLLIADGGTSAGFVSEGGPIPVSKANFTAPTFLKAARCAGISVITRELARLSTPAADALLAADIARGVALGLDLAFVDTTTAPSADVPGGIFYNAPSVPSSGSTLAAIDADLDSLVSLLSDADIDLTTAVWLMAPQTCLYLARLRGSGGARAFCDLTVTGGTLLGLPVLTSRAMQQSGSPGNGIIGLVAADSVLLGDESQSEILISTGTSLQLNSAPGAGASTHVGLFQNDLIAVRGTRFVRWQRRHDAGAAYISGVSY